MLQDCKTDVKTVTVSCLRPALHMQRIGCNFSADFMEVGCDFSCA